MRNKGKILKDNKIPRINKELCLGCGLCMEYCPRQAISIRLGIAYIDRNKCNHCGLCFDICPQGAISKFVPVSKDELRLMINSLKKRTDILIKELERCNNQ